MNKHFFRQAFIITLPVLTGYLALGTAFGVLFSKLGLMVPWAAVMSVTIYGGSMQLAGVTMIGESMPLLQIAMLSVVINIRHVVYGLSLIEPFRGGGWRKIYLIFALTDETYALLTSMKIPEGVNRHKFMFTVAILNHFYWIIGGVIGAVAGVVLKFNSKGIEFSMAAIFIVILTEQCRVKCNRVPAAIGGAATILAWIFFGASNMLPPAMAAILMILLVFRRKIIRKHPEFEVNA